ncbi:MAG: hypothetical protein AAFP03_11420, partial [Cyanobacteria bacterium J06598_3]
EKLGASSRAGIPASWSAARKSLDIVNIRTHLSGVKDKLPIGENRFTPLMAGAVAFFRPARIHPSVMKSKYYVSAAVKTFLRG